MNKKAENQNGYLNSRKPYIPAKVEKIFIDKDISIQLLSPPPGDPMSNNMNNGSDNGESNPYA